VPVACVFLRPVVAVLGLLAWLMSPVSAHGRLGLDNPDPGGFFTNVAARLLQSELDVDLARIPIYPTNRYTPAVHRLLQVTANLYDSTTTNLFPTLFRPRFGADGTNVFICGYEVVDPTNTSYLTTPVDLNEAVRGGWISNDTRLNIYGIPWIIGVKKGLPNFNELRLQSVIQITRKLQVTRPSVQAQRSAYTTSQMLILGISNSVGVEVWNSYSDAYPRPAYIQADGDFLVTLTNDVGLPTIITNIQVGGADPGFGMGSIALEANAWPGTGWSSNFWFPPNPGSFQVPLLTNLIVLPDSVLEQKPWQLRPVSPGTPENWAAIQTNYFPQPNWGLSITGHLRCLILDGGPPGQGRVVDYVQLSGLNSQRELGDELYTSDVSLSINNLWGTNSATSLLGTNSLGIVNQIITSAGSLPASDQDWAQWMIGAPSGAAKQWAIDNFRSFLGLQPFYDPYLKNTQLVMQAPFTPTSRKVQLLVWQANDPLVHHTVDELQGLYWLGRILSFRAYELIPPVQSNFWRLTDSYSPWGGNPLYSGYGDFQYFNAHNLSVKDPVRSSDEWDFPVGEPLSFATVGRIHRGTPWQTLYLRSGDIAGSVAAGYWQRWTGNTNATDAALTRPVMDRHLVNLIGPELTTNCLRHRMSINQDDVATWQDLLDGLTVATNSLPAVPLIIASNSPQALAIAQGINDTRSRKDLFPDGFFHQLSDVLATPQLTEQSPFLDTNLWFLYYYTILTDELLEALPSRLLPLLREDSFGAMLKSNGQVTLQFSGYDDHAYAIEVSRDLVHWRFLAIGHPTNGVFSLPLAMSPHSRGEYYRSLLLPRASRHEPRHHEKEPPRHQPARGTHGEQRISFGGAHDP
jgi:hypothetical protein